MKIQTTCARCGEEATLPTVETLLTYLRGHEETCPPATKDAS